MTEHNYHQPRVIRLHTEDLEHAHQAGAALAAQLAEGNTSPLPDGVHSFLAQHYMAISTDRVGRARNEIADELVPPFTPQDAQRIGGMVARLLDTANESAVMISTTDTLGAAFFSTDFNGGAEAPEA